MKSIEQRCFVAWNHGDDCWDQLTPEDKVDWQAAAKVATDAERARCLRICRDSGDAGGDILERIESGEEP